MRSIRLFGSILSFHFYYHIYYYIIHFFATLTCKFLKGVFYLKPDIFCERVAEELAKLGVSEADVNTQLQNFKNYFASFSEEEVQKKLEAFGDPEDVAYDIYDKLHNDAPQNIQTQEAVSRKDAASDSADGTNDEQITLVYKMPEQAKPALSSVKKPAKNGSSALFWVLFLLTLPITVPLALALFSVIFVLDIAIMAVIVLFAVILAVVIAVGTMLALIGIIYGIIALMQSLPAGLFEIGIGVIALGATTFIGILVYNFSFRLLPFLLRKNFSLFGIVGRMIKKLFVTAKRACC